MSFERDGYEIHHRWFDNSLTADLADALKALDDGSKDNGELYDTLWLTPQFLRMASLIRTQMQANRLLGRGLFDPLYLYNSRCLIQPPNDDSHCWSWHQEVFHAIPETRFVQTWAPLVYDANEENGTIEVLPGSHREGIAKQAWTDEGTGYALVDKAVTDKYTPVALPLPVGSMLFFDGRLIHRSGKNRSYRNRYAMVGVYTVTGDRFRAPKPDWKWRGKSPRGWLDEQP